MINLVDERKKRGLTLAAVAKATGLTISMVRDLEQRLGEGYGAARKMTLSDYYHLRFFEAFPEERDKLLPLVMRAQPHIGPEEQQCLEAIHALVTRPRQALTPDEQASRERLLGLVTKAPMSVVERKAKRAEIRAAREAQRAARESKK